MVVRTFDANSVLETLVAQPTSEDFTRTGSDGIWLKIQSYDTLTGIMIPQSYPLSVQLKTDQKLTQGDIVYVQDFLAPGVKTITPKQINIFPTNSSYTEFPIIREVFSVDGRLKAYRDNGGIAFAVLDVFGKDLTVVIEDSYLDNVKALNPKIGQLVSVVASLQPRAGGKGDLPFELHLNKNISRGRIQVSGRPSTSIQEVLTASAKQNGVVPFLDWLSHYSNELIMMHPDFKRLQSVYSGIDTYFQDHFRKKGFAKFIPTELAAGSAEGGARVFTLALQDRHLPLSLAQSPQIQKEIYCMTSMKPVYTTLEAFRGDPSNTRRHVPEFHALDVEIPVLNPNINVMDHVMNTLEEFIFSLYNHVSTEYQQTLKSLGTNIVLPTRPFMRLSFEEAKEILEDYIKLAYDQRGKVLSVITEVMEKTKESDINEIFSKKHEKLLTHTISKQKLDIKNGIMEFSEIVYGFHSKNINYSFNDFKRVFYGGDYEGKTEADYDDLSTKAEKVLCQHAQQKTGFSGIFVHSFYLESKPFYIKPSSNGTSKSFDLLLGGIEVASGGERINTEDGLSSGLNRKKMRLTNDLKDYSNLMAYGAPRHGGFGLGAERLMAAMFGMAAKQLRPLIPSAYQSS